jgi:hypothetical protein
VDLNEGTVKSDLVEPFSRLSFFEDQIFSNIHRKEPKTTDKNAISPNPDASKHIKTEI